MPIKFRWGNRSWSHLNSYKKKKRIKMILVSKICINFVYTPEVGGLVIYDITRHLSKPRFKKKYLD